MARLNVAMVGCGWVAELQIDNGFSHLPDLFEVAACCDIDRAKTDDFADRYGIERRFSSSRRRARRSRHRRGQHLHAALAPPPDGDGRAGGREARHLRKALHQLAPVHRRDHRGREAGQRTRVMPIFQYRFGPGVARVRHVIASRSRGPAVRLVGGDRLGAGRRVLQGRPGGGSSPPSSGACS